MAYMPCDINWERKDFIALAKRLSYAAVAARDNTENEELEEAKRLAAVHCKIYLAEYEKNHEFL